MSRADHTRSPLLPVRARAAVCTRACCLCTIVCPSVRAQPRGLGAGPSGCSPARASCGQGRARGAGGAAGRPGRAQTRASRLFVCRLRLRAAGGHHFLLRSGQAHKREGGCRPSPSSFPQMPSAAGLLLQYGPRRLSPRPGGLPGCAALWPPSRLARPQTASSASLFV